MRLVLLTVCLAVLTGCSQRPASAGRSLPTALEARAPQIHGAVVFLGDSRVALLATSNVADRSENLGVNGQTLSGLDAELRGVDSRARRPS